MGFIGPRYSVLQMFHRAAIMGEKFKAQCLKLEGKEIGLKTEINQHQAHVVSDGTHYIMTYNFIA